MKRRHSSRLQAIPIASNRLVTLWLKQSQSWQVKKLVKPRWRFLSSAICTLSSDKFHCWNLDVRSSALDLVRLRSLTNSLRSFWLGYYGFLSSVASLEAESTKSSSKGQGERFHQDVLDFEHRCQGMYNKNITGDCIWGWFVEMIYSIMANLEKLLTSKSYVVTFV